MRILVCGDRNWDDPWIICAAVSGLATCSPEEIVIIDGDARGADRMAGEISGFQNYWHSQGVVHETYPADWNKHHKAAGPIRNKKMLHVGKPDVVLAFHDDLENSRGTGHMVKIASEAGVPVYNIRRIPPKSLAAPSEHP